MNKLTREEALRRWKSAKVTKKAMVDKALDPKEMLQSHKFTLK